MSSERSWESNLVKVVVSTSMGKMDKSSEDLCNLSLSRICLQVPKITRMKKSISNFGIRKGMKVGGMITLRGDAARNFWLKLLLFVLPADPLFRGFKISCVNANTFNFGFRSIGNFPEFSEIKRDMGLNVSIVFLKNINVWDVLEQMKVPFLK